MNYSEYKKKLKEFNLKEIDLIDGEIFKADNNRNYRINIKNYKERLLFIFLIQRRRYKIYTILATIRKDKEAYLERYNYILELILNKKWVKCRFNKNDFINKLKNNIDLKIWYFDKEWTFNNKKLIFDNDYDFLIKYTIIVNINKYGFIGNSFSFLQKNIDLIGFYFNDDLDKNTHLYQDIIQIKNILKEYYIIDDKKFTLLFLKDNKNIYIEYLNLLKNKATALNSFKSIIASINFFNNFLNKHKYKYENINRILLEEFKKYIFEKENKRNIFMFVKTFCDFLLLKSILKKNYFIKNEYRKKKKIKNKIKILTKDEVKLLINKLEEFQPKIRIFTLLLIQTPLRFSDIQNLKKEEITKYNITKIEKKTGKKISININDNLYNLINIYIKTNKIKKYIFVNKRHQFIRSTTVLKHIRKIIPGVNLHDFRRTIASNIYNKTNDIFLVKKLLNHSEIETTKEYIGIING